MRRIEGIAAIDRQKGERILDSVSFETITNPYLLVKREEKRTVFTDSQETSHLKSEFEKKKRVLETLEKQKLVTGRKEPAHSSKPVTLLSTETETIHLQNPPEQLTIPVPVPSSQQDYYTKYHLDQKPYDFWSQLPLEDFLHKVKADVGDRDFTRV